MSNNPNKCLQVCHFHKNDKMTKKAQALSMNTIIIAALALLVLAIISLIFIGKMNGARSDLNNCENNGGTCTTIGDGISSCQDKIDRGDWSNPQGYTLGRQMGSYKCYNAITGNVEPNKICCSFT